MNRVVLSFEQLSCSSHQSWITKVRRCSVRSPDKAAKTNRKALPVSAKLSIRGARVHAVNRDKASSVFCSQPTALAGSCRSKFTHLSHRHSQAVENARVGEVMFDCASCPQFHILQSIFSSTTVTHPSRFPAHLRHHLAGSQLSPRSPLPVPLHCP